MNKEPARKNQGSAIRTARLFRNGKNQAVRLPREFEMKASEVIIRKQGESLILTPKPETWQDYFASAQSLGDDFPEDISDLPFETREEL
ncbi:MAG: type II toxin-antitoxin system VapB family antitoxin [Desulfobacteraceae bacterium]|nr:type II toxin-antitoxin system VapB family antitoxin [Desulfobacteraceae bacterium]